MKYLFIIFLFASKFCSGQADTSFYIGDSSMSLGIHIGYEGGYDYSQDTVPVFMLVMDTLHYSNYTPQLNDGNYFDKAGAATWVKGHVVRQITITKAGQHRSSDGFGMWYQQQDETSYQTIQYLDGNNKPLSKYIVVWMVQ